MIHVCFALYDGTGTYSRFTGTAMLSLFENVHNTPPHLPSITVHLLHDNTLTDDNRDKLIQIAERYEQKLKFYNVEELCADRLAAIYEYFPKIKDSHFSIATFYRFFIPHLLLPQGIEKAIYLDSDIIVNLDIAEFWQVELGDKPLGVVTETANGVPIKNFVNLVREGVIEEENYFNAGILLMNLRVLHNEKSNILAGVKFISELPVQYFDQDVLNYCFSTATLKLPIKFNFYVEYARARNEWIIDNKIYHYANGKVSFIIDANDPYSRLFMDYFIKTPWVDADTAAILSGKSLPYRKIPAVSVVIPMYNEEKRISNCLDSLLIQTFQDFEVIVVDDCSTDNSVAVVESYIPKFNGRLKLTHTEKNSGTDCFPRNIGMMLAHGEYIQFIDADDMILGTALETLYKAAILYDADVVYTSQHYIWNASDNIVLYKDGTSQKMNWVNTDLVIDDPSTNLSRLLLEPNEGNFHSAWTKFVRHDFMLRNQIFFANLPLAGDFVGVINMYCHTKRLLRISTPLYFYRTFNDHAMSRRTRQPQEQCRHWFSSFVKFAKALRELENENEVLAENPFHCLEASKKTFAWSLNQTKYARKQIDTKDFYKVLHRDFDKSSLDSLAVLLPFLFSFINEKVSNDYYIEPFNKFRLHFTAEVFVRINKKMDKEAIQILSVSDDKARLTKPEWWQREGTCHVINSYRGKLEIVAKAVVAGNVQIHLGGPYVLNQETSELVPYWIDYTKLIVNGQTIFNTLTPAWNAKHYVYNMDAKAGEEIKVQVEWLPHRVDSLEQKVPSLPDKFKPFITARIDVKLLSPTGDLEILSASDENASITKPNWLQKNGMGYMLTSSAGNLTFNAKATANGQISLNLRGLEVRNPENKSKLIPYWIDYTKLTINGQTIFNTLTPVWHGKPCLYKTEVKTGEEIKVQVEWLPHRADTVDSLEQKVPSLPDKFKPFITARIDVKLLSPTGDLEILSASDENVSITKPNWLQKNGMGYMLTSSAGNLIFNAKATANGQISLNLRGLEVRDPENKSKLIPYWIDYTKLTINGKAIFDAPTPAWQGKPSLYKTEVKAGEEIKIHIEWQPHRSDT